MAIDRIWCYVSKKRKPHRLEAEVAHAQKAESQTSNHGAQLFAAVMVGGNKPTPACLLELKARLLDTTFQTGSKILFSHTQSGNSAVSSSGACADVAFPRGCARHAVKSLLMY